MKKKTAVEWLVESLESLEYSVEKGMISLDDYTINVQWVKNQSKVNEKEQIKDAVNYGCSDWGSFKDAEQYYNETYGN